MFGNKKETNKKRNFWSEVMTDACAREFVDGNFANKHNCITLSQAGADQTLNRKNNFTYL